jgi:hypothetical protein
LSVCRSRPDFTAAGEFRDQVPQYQRCTDIEAREGFIKQDEVRVVHERCGKQNLLAHAFGVVIPLPVESRRARCFLFLNQEKPYSLTDRKIPLPVEFHDFQRDMVPVSSSISGAVAFASS